MAIVDGQRVRALESNAAWCSKTVNNTITGIQTLANGTSGPTINNLQQTVNDLVTDVATIENDIVNIQNDIVQLQSIDTFVYAGNWDASTNTPTLADGDGALPHGPGSVYRVSVAGTQDLGSGSVSYNVGDKIVYNLAGIYEKWDVQDEPFEKSKVEYRTITAGEESAKSLTLAETPAEVAEVLLNIKGGGPQFYGDDFTVSGTTLSWSGLDLDGVLLENDKVIIQYIYI